MTLDDIQGRFLELFDPNLYNQSALYLSRKGGTLRFHNSYFYMMAYSLDGWFPVSHFHFETVPYRYLNPHIGMHCEGKIPFDIHFRDGSRRLVFVTSEYFRPDQEHLIEGAEKKARSLGIPFEVWTEPELFGKNPLYMPSILTYILEENRRYFQPKKREKLE